MAKKKVLVISDLGGCPPHMFYESLAEHYHVISYAPRPFALTASHARYMEQFSAAVIKDTDYLRTLDDYRHPASIYWATEEYRKSEVEVVEDIKRIASMFRVDAITTNNELFIVPMAIACEQLGLRGAGSEAAKRARDKNLMRECFNRAGVTAIRSARVCSLDDFRAALTAVRLPMILKPSYLASSISVRLIDGSTDPEGVFLEVQKQLAAVPVPDSVTYEAPFIVETFLQGCYEDWYDQEGYADYVSVEGIMAEGVYHPLVINDKTPMIPSFVETSHITPTVLDEDARAIVVETARKACESLGLQNCATHTEIKLMKGRAASVIETAARFGGWNIIPQIKTSFGLDAPQVLADVLINGASDRLPRGMLSRPDRYSANLHLFLSDYRDRMGELLFGEVRFRNINIPPHLFAGDTVMTSFHTIESGTPLYLEDFFEALHALASVDLISGNAEDLLATLQNLRRFSVLAVDTAGQPEALANR